MISVYTRHLAELLKRGQTLIPTFIAASLFIAAAMLLPSLALAYYGEPALAWLLGERWRGAGVFLEILAPLMFFSSLVIPANVMMVVCRRQARLLIIQIVTSVALTMGFLASYWYWNNAETTLRVMVTIYSIRHLSVVWGAFVVGNRSRCIESALTGSVRADES